MHMLDLHKQLSLFINLTLRPSSSGMPVLIPTKECDYSRKKSDDLQFQQVNPALRIKGEAIDDMACTD